MTDVAETVKVQELVLSIDREVRLRDPLALYNRAIKDFVRPALEGAVKKLGAGFNIGRSLPLGTDSIGVANEAVIDTGYDKEGCLLTCPPGWSSLRSPGGHRIRRKSALFGVRFD
jgi:hypothetical protein